MKKIITITGLLLLGYFTAHADKTIYVAPSASGSGNGIDASNPCTISTALANLDASGGTTTLVFPTNGTFTLSAAISVPDATTKKIIFEGNNSTLNGQNNGSFRILRLGTSTDIEIRNITFKNGKLSGAVGGAIYFAGDSLKISGCTFDGNSSQGGGGALASNGKYLKISNSVFKNNKVLTNGTYGIAVSHTGTTAGGTLIVENTTFNNNAAGNGLAAFGSAICTAYDGTTNNYLNTILINNCTFYKNLSSLTTTYGYATVYLYDPSAAGTPTTATFVNNTFYGNSNCGIYIQGIKQNVKLVNNVIVGDSYATINVLNYQDHGVIAGSTIAAGRPAIVGKNNYIVAKNPIGSTNITESSFQSGTNGNTFVSTSAQSVIDAVYLNSTLSSSTVPYLTVTNALSPLLNTGTSSVSGVTIPSTDVTGFQRTAGYTIGAYQATLNVANGTTQTVNQDASLLGVTIQPTGKLTLAAGKSLTVGTFSIQSDVNGTGTFINNGTLNNSNASVQQYLPNARNWYISSPVTGAVAPSGYTYYQRDEVGSSWISQPFVAGNNFVVGKGYIVMPDVAASTIEFSGTLNNGNVDIALTKSGSGFNLIGNPYSSHLSWTAAFVDDETNAALIEPTIWVRTNAGSVNSGGNAAWSFLTYNGHSGEAVPSTSLLTDGIIPPMQAFWVKAKAAGTLTLDNKLTRSHQTANPLKAPTIKNTNRQRIRLEVSNGRATDETLIYFDAVAADAYDAYDSPKMFINLAAIPEIYTLAGTEKLVINGMNELKTDIEIPLGFVTGENKMHTLLVKELININQNVRITLIDKQKNTVTELSEGASYSFSTDVTPASTDRFSLLFRAPSVSTRLDDGNASTVYSYINPANQIVIVAPEKSNYAIYNSVGQLMEKGFLTSNCQTSNLKLAVGMYVVKIGNNYSTRVIVKQ
jgi:hypothetical protein